MPKGKRSRILKKPYWAKLKYMLCTHCGKSFDKDAEWVFDDGLFYMHVSCSDKLDVIAQKRGD